MAYKYDEKTLRIGLKLFEVVAAIGMWDLEFLEDIGI